MDTTIENTYLFSELQEANDLFDLKKLRSYITASDAVSLKDENGEEQGFVYFKNYFFKGNPIKVLIDDGHNQPYESKDGRKIEDSILMVILDLLRELEAKTEIELHKKGISRYTDSDEEIATMIMKRVIPLFYRKIDSILNIIVIKE